MASASVPSAVAAVFIIHLVMQRYGSAERMVKTGLGLVLVMAAVASAVNDILKRRNGARPSLLPPIDPQTIKTKIMVIAALVGFLVGLTSVGSGSLIAIVLLMISRLAPRTIVGTDIAHALLLVTAAAIAHWSLGTVNVRLALNLLVGSLPGVLLGSRLAYHAPGRPLRWGLAVLIFAGGIKML
jgi:uncharacterized membrane protein YfcA